MKKLIVEYKNGKTVTSIAEKYGISKWKLYRYIEKNNIVVDKLNVFINKANKKYNNKYDYSKSIYVGSHSNIEIICPIHGSFWTTPANHLQKIICPKCKIDKERKELSEERKEIFLEKANKIYNNKYNYNKVKYVNSNFKVKIICPKHGEFLISPDNHLNAKMGCPKCYGYICDTESFINKANKIHNNKYNYSKVKYINNQTKVEIICPIHGIFKKNSINHINGKQGCPICSKKKSLLVSSIKQQELFIKKAKKLHGNTYNYSKVNYINAHTKIIIICSKHGEFLQFPMNHLEPCGCPTCSSSKGEIAIKKYLNQNKIKYISEYSFVDCINPETNSRLYFDFYLPQYNLLIEYDGVQHFKAIDIFGGEEGLKKSKYFEKLKSKYIIKNNINLFRIPYWEIKNIDSILNKKIPTFGGDFK